MRRLALLLASLAVFVPVGCRDDAPPESAAKAKAAASRAQIGPVTLVAGEGEDTMPTVVVAVTEDGLAFGGRLLGGWEPSASAALLRGRCRSAG